MLKKETQRINLKISNGTKNSIKPSIIYFSC